MEKLAPERGQDPQAWKENPLPPQSGPTRDSLSAAFTQADSSLVNPQSRPLFIRSRSRAGQGSLVVECVGLGSRLPAFKSQLFPYLPRQPVYFSVPHFPYL